MNSPEVLELCWVFVSNSPGYGLFPMLGGGRIGVDPEYCPGPDVASWASILGTAQEW